MLLAPPPEPQWSPVDGRRSFQIPETAPTPLQISGYAPDTKRALLILPSFKILQWEVIEMAK